MIHSTLSKRNKRIGIGCLSYGALVNCVFRCKSSIKVILVLFFRISLVCTLVVTVEGSLSWRNIMMRPPWDLALHLRNTCSRPSPDCFAMFLCQDCFSSLWGTKTNVTYQSDENHPDWFVLYLMLESHLLSPWHLSLKDLTIPVDFFFPPRSQGIRDHSMAKALLLNAIIQLMFWLMFCHLEW